MKFNSSSYIIVFVFILVVHFISCKKSVVEIAKKSENAIFTVYTYNEFGTPKSTGTGFFINKQGLGITNYHVLDGSVKASIQMKNGTIFEIDEIVTANRTSDIITFRIKNTNNQAIPFLRISNKGVRAGENILVVGSPLGLENSISEGVVSSIRKDLKNGELLQITAPISSGSSGSPIINEKGNVIAIATYQIERGQNLNFGVVIDENIINLSDNKDFIDRNYRFASNDFLILNKKSDRDVCLTLNSIEFGPSSTIIYMSYLNLDIHTKEMGIWTDIGNSEKSFYIQDLHTTEKIEIISSTIGANRDDRTLVPLMTLKQFKLFFPALKKEVKEITIKEGVSVNSWTFSNIDLDNYRDQVKFENEDNQYYNILSNLNSSNLKSEKEKLINLLEESPSNYLLINTLGVISYLIDNNHDAISFFSNAITLHPSETLAYKNRSYIYKTQDDKDSFLDDISKIITLEPNNIEFLQQRFFLYYEMKKWDRALLDVDKIISSEEGKHPLHYCLRSVCNNHLGNKNEACLDLDEAYRISSNDIDTKIVMDLWLKLGCR